LAAQGRDVKLAMSRVEGYRNFATKLWNASRYAEMNGAVLAADYKPDTCQHALNQWILVELQTTATAVADALDAYTFNEAAERAYHFVWGTFCDWYLEFTKPLLQSNDVQIVTETKQTIAFVLAEIVKILHPFMPFITDELAEKLGVSDKPLLFSAWTTLSLPEHFTVKAKNVSILQQIITEIRSAKAEMNVPPATPCDAVVIGTAPAQQAMLNENKSLLQKMARLKTLAFNDVAPPQSVQLVIDGMTIALPLGGMIDIAQEKQRLAKELKALEADIARVENKLNNPQFVAKASAEVVAEQQQKRDGFIVTKNKLEQSLQRLQAA
jgi:valyl-tRNA synthetase